jgi:stage II sporulation protein M
MKRNFFRGFSDSWSFVKHSKNFILSIVLIFLVSALVGVLFPEFLSDRIKEYLIGLFDRVKDYGFWQLFFFIFSNNLSSAFFSLVLGAAFGVFPLIVAVLNGYVLGFVAGKSASIAGPGILWRLLPHGIFELPAIFLSLGLGLRLGTALFYPDGRKNYYSLVKSCFLAFVRFVIPLLIIAALIESALIFFL